MCDFIELILPELNQHIDPTFYDPQVNYMGCIEGFEHEDVGPQQTGFLDMCLSGLEMFAVRSDRADGIVFMRTGDELIIMTENNAEVIQEESMREIVQRLGEAVSELAKQQDTTDDGGMFM